MTIVRIFQDGGVIMWPMLIVTLVVVTLTVRSARRLSRVEAGSVAVASGIDAILLWAVYGVVLGLIGTLVGFVEAAQAIQVAGSVATSLVWAGIKIALIPTIAGLLIFALAAPAWFYLRRAYLLRAGHASA